MVRILDNSHWWIRLFVLLPLGVRFHAYGQTTEQVALWLGLSVLFGTIWLWSWSPEPDPAAPGKIPTSRWFSLVFVASVALLSMEFDDSGLAVGVLLGGMISSLVMGCRFMVLAPLVLGSLPTAGAAPLSAESEMQYAIVVIATAVVGWWAISRNGVAQPESPSSVSKQSRLPRVGLPRWESTRDLAQAGLIAVLAIGTAIAVVPNLNEPTPNGPGRAAASGWGIGDQADLLQRPNRSDAVVAWVWSDTPGYWRMSTLDTWDGRYWSSSANERSDLRAGSDGWIDLVDGFDWDGGAVPTRIVQEQIQFAKGGARTLLGRPSTFAVHVPQDNVTLHSDRTVTVDRAFTTSESLSIISKIPVTNADLLRNHDPAGAPYSDAFQAINLDYSELSPALVELAAEITAGQTTSYDRLRALEQWFDNNIQYNINSPLPPEGVDPLEFLLLQDKTGYCEQMATSLTLMARSLGIPARLAAGFVSSEYDEDHWVVRSENAHAWTEVHFPDVGWVTFDPTEGTLPVSPAAAEQTTMPSLTNFYLGFAVLLAAVVVVSGVLLLGSLVGPRKSWLDKTVERVYTIAGGRYRVEQHHTIDNCLENLVPTGAPGFDDVTWLRGVLSSAAYGDAGVSDTDQARCNKILKQLERSGRR